MYQLKTNAEELRNQVADIVFFNLQTQEIFDKLINIFSKIEYQIQTGFSIRESLTCQNEIAEVDKIISKLKLEKEETQQDIIDITSIMNKDNQMLKAAQAILNNLTQKA